MTGKNRIMIYGPKADSSTILCAHPFAGDRVAWFD
jgi:hypothetical protein